MSSKGERVEKIILIDDMYLMQESITKMHSDLDRMWKLLDIYKEKLKRDVEAGRL